MQITDDDMRQASLEHPELQSVYKIIKESQLTVQDIWEGSSSILPLYKTFNRELKAGVIITIFSL